MQQNLNRHFPIVDPATGCPNDYFMGLFQQRAEDFDPLTVFTIVDGKVGINALAPSGPLEVNAAAVNTPAIVATDGLMAAPIGTKLIGGFGCVLMLGAKNYNADYQLGYFSDTYGNVANYQAPGNGLTFDFYTLADALTGGTAILPDGGVGCTGSAYTDWGGVYALSGTKFGVGKVTGDFIKGNYGTPAIVFDTNGNSVGINTSSPNASAALDVTSTTKAFMPPRMTTAQKNAISSPAAGMVVFDTTLAALCVYQGGAWVTYGASGSGSSLWTVVDDYTLPGAVASRVVAVSAYDEILVQFLEVTAAGATQRGVQVSVDGGATYYTTLGDYYAYDNTGVKATTQQFNAHSTGSTAARGGFVHIKGLRQSTGPKNALVGASSVDAVFAASNSAITHIRAVTGAGGTNMSAGRIVTYGR